MLTAQILSLRCCSIKVFPFGIVREALRCPCLPRVFRMAKGSQVVVLIPALGRLRKANLREFKARLVYRRAPGRPGLH